MLLAADPTESVTLQMVAFDFNLTTREMWNCFRIQYLEAVGTMFFIAAKQGPALVTARHILECAVVGDNVLISGKEGAQSHRLVQLAFADDNSDLCIFRLSNVEEPKQQMVPYPEPKILAGGMVKFLGFPHGLSGDYPDVGFPTPLVRTAFFSGVAQISLTKIVILDGFNNPGYSGGPVYCSDGASNVALFGMVSGYKHELQSHGRIYKKDEAQNETILPDVYTKPNSGMIYAVSRQQIDSLIFQIDT